MNWVDAWNELTYLDGAMFSAWLIGMYYAKCYIDRRFR